MSCTIAGAGVGDSRRLLAASDDALMIASTEGPCCGCGSARAGGRSSSPASAVTAASVAAAGSMLCCMEGMQERLGVTGGSGGSAGGVGSVGALQALPRLARRPRRRLDEGWAPGSCSCSGAQCWCGGSGTRRAARRSAILSLIRPSATSNTFIYPIQRAHHLPGLKSSFIDPLDKLFMLQFLKPPKNDRL